MATGLVERRGWSSLHEAAAHPEEYKLLEMLVREDSSKVNQQTSQGETPLLLACQYKCVEVAEKVVTLLIQHGANVNISDNQDRTPLLYAAMKGKLKVVTTLLNSGHADPDLGDNFGRNPVHEAAIGGHWEIVECLLEVNASILGETMDGVTPVYLAAKHGKSGCLRKVLEVVVRKGQKTLIDLPTKYRGFTPLMGAASNGHKECVQILLEYSANPNLKTDSSVIRGSVTALHLAVYGNHASCVKLLFEKMDIADLAHSADPTTDHVCPLKVAVKKRSNESLKVLLSLGFPVNNVHRILHKEGILGARGQANMMYVLTLPNYETALSYAAVLEDIDSMKILLNYGASVNPVLFRIWRETGVQEELSFPPILSSIFRDSWGPLDLLIEHGCNLNYFDSSMSLNQLLLLSFCDYDSTKKLLMCGSDPHLLFRETNDCRRVTIRHLSYILTRIGQDKAIEILQLVLQFSEISRVVQHFCYNVSYVCHMRQMLRGAKESFVKNWLPIFQEVDEPSSLSNMCRIKIRQLMIDVHGYRSFRTAIHFLSLPHILKQYLLYDEIIKRGHMI